MHIRDVPRGVIGAACALLLVLGVAGQGVRAMATGQESVSAPAGDIEQGKERFIAIGCYACHGIEGQGGFGGPKLGPDPMAFPAFVRYVRAPTGSMPPYTETLLPDEQDLADIHAYLRARPGPAPLSVLPPP
jgi:mono/diheme cytochrome c family protein